MKHIKSLCLSLILITGAASAMNPARELSQAERAELGEQFLDAVCRQDQERSTQLIAAGADVNATDHFGPTPLHIVCMYWKKEAFAQQLIAAGADVNTADQDGNTPLHYVCIHWMNEEIAQQLIASKANVNAINQYDYTPLCYACNHWENRAITNQLAEHMLRTLNAEQRQRVRTFLCCLKRLNAHPQLRHVFKEPLLNMIAEENAANSNSLFRQQIDPMNNTKIKQNLLDKYVPKETI